MINTYPLSACSLPDTARQEAAVGLQPQEVHPQPGQEDTKGSPSQEGVFWGQLSLATFLQAYYVFQKHFSSIF